MGKKIPKIPKIPVIAVHCPQCEFRILFVQDTKDVGWVSESLKYSLVMVLDVDSMICPKCKAEILLPPAEVMDVERLPPAELFDMERNPLYQQYKQSGLLEVPQLFDLGQRVLCTPDGLDALERAGVEPRVLVGRHATGDWGDLGDDDKTYNDLCVKKGNQVSSAYNIAEGVVVWVVTDADRSKTIIMRSDEFAHLDNED